MGNGIDNYNMAIHAQIQECLDKARDLYDEVNDLVGMYIEACHLAERVGYSEDDIVPDEAGWVEALENLQNEMEKLDLN